MSSDTFLDLEIKSTLYFRALVRLHAADLVPLCSDG